jgi:hypothetical protein
MGAFRDLWEEEKFVATVVVIGSLVTISFLAWLAVDWILDVPAEQKCSKIVSEPRCVSGGGLFGGRTKCRFVLENGERATVPWLVLQGDRFCWPER